MRDLNECQAEVFRRSEKRIKERKQHRKHILLACVPLAICLTVICVLFLPKQAPAQQEPTDSAANGTVIYYSQMADPGTIKVSGPWFNKVYTDGSDVYQITAVLSDCLSTRPGSNSAIDGAIANEEAPSASNSDIIDGALVNRSPAEYTITFIPAWGHSIEWHLTGNTLEITSTGHTVTLSDTQVTLLKDTLGIKEDARMKRISIIVLVIGLLLAVLFVPIPNPKANTPHDNRQYTALTYKVVCWNTCGGAFQKTAWYGFPDNFKSLDELWVKYVEPMVQTVTATVVEINEDTVVVQPIKEEEKLHSTDRLCFSKKHLARIDPAVGSDVDIDYIGDITETYPVRIQALRWRMATNLRHREYSEPWLNPETSRQHFEHQGPAFTDINITEIYYNCFFARPIDKPYTIKLNGQLSDEWMVGDLVICTYEKLYFDEENRRMEADLLTVQASDTVVEYGVLF